MICHTRRYGQLERVHATAELLRQFSFGCRLSFINQEISERLGERICERTTRRDLEFLERLGLIDIDRPPRNGNRMAQPRYQWAGQRPLFESNPSRLATSKGGAA